VVVIGVVIIVTFATWIVRGIRRRWGRGPTAAGLPATR